MGTEVRLVPSKVAVDATLKQDNKAGPPPPVVIDSKLAGTLTSKFRCTDGSYPMGDIYYDAQASATWSLATQ